MTTEQIKQEAEAHFRDVSYKPSLEELRPNMAVLYAYNKGNTDVCKPDQVHWFRDEGDFSDAVAKAEAEKKKLLFFGYRYCNVAGTNGQIKDGKIT